MKIKVKSKPYEQVMALEKPKNKPPKKPSLLFTTVVRLLAIFDLAKVGFTYTATDMEKLGNSPCLILMNHSSFIDLKIASKIFYPKPYCIVCTSDGFVGKEWLMRLLGCIPTKKFVTDISLLGSMSTAIKKGASVLMYPEASYTFDGANGALPRRLGIIFKKLGVPVVTVITKGAFSHDPLYNCLQRRKVKVSAEVKCLYSAEQIKELSVEELDRGLDEVFTFDGFKWQQDNRVKIDAPFRADGLNRILYKCPHCLSEGKTVGKGTTLTCTACGKTYELDEYGAIAATDGDSAFTHIPDWYNYERECVRREIEDGSYLLDTEVEICMMVDYKAIYRVGNGRLIHNADGFTLTGCDGKLNYRHPPLSSYSLYSDYYWYERGDIICIGNSDCLYYCFPKCNDVVAKTRLAAEELYKLARARRKSTPKA